MKVKAGKYTLALTMIICGILMLLNALNGGGSFRGLFLYSPVVLIIFGLEVIALNLYYQNREDCKVKVSVSSLIAIIIVLVIFTLGTNKVEITGLDSFIDIDF